MTILTKTKSTELAELAEFAELGLKPELLRAIEDAQYTTPTPIQAQAIPVVLDDRDVLACAQTGTGKTAAFLLPILQDLMDGKRGRLRALVLSPTRELAAQIGNSALTYGKYLQIRTAVVFGGVGLEPQAKRLRRGVDLLIATPGRLLDHIRRGNVDFSNLDVCVLDEADRMLDMGFLPDVRRIFQALPLERQTLMFSATMPSEIERLAHEVLESPVSIDVGRRATPVDAVRQILFPVEAAKKRDLLCHLLKYGHMQHVLVFTRTKSRADQLARYLVQTGRNVAALHGDKSQRSRTQILDRFRTGRVDILVATDLAARGIDVEGISHVVNFDVPNVPEDYVHRIGRTARAAATGYALSLASSDELSLIRAIENAIGAPIPCKVIKGFEPDAFTIRRFKQPNLRSARIARGAIRQFTPRGQKRW